MGLVTSLVIAGTALQVGSQVSGAMGARRAANDAVTEGNRLAENAIDRGNEDARRYGMDLSRFVGRQRVAAAASNVDASTGSAAQVIAETERFGAQDADMIRENALREAYALRRGGQNAASQMRNQANQQLLGAFGTALSAGARGWEAYQAGRGGMALRSPVAPGPRSNIRIDRPAFDYARPNF